MALGSGILGRHNVTATVRAGHWGAPGIILTTDLGTVQEASASQVCTETFRDFFLGTQQWEIWAFLRDSSDCVLHITVSSRVRNVPRSQPQRLW